MVQYRFSVRMTEHEAFVLLLRRRLRRLLHGFRGFLALQHRATLLAICLDLRYNRRQQRLHQRGVRILLLGSGILRHGRLGLFRYDYLLIASRRRYGHFLFLLHPCPFLTFRLLFLSGFCLNGSRLGRFLFRLRLYRILGLRLRGLRRTSFLAAFGFLRLLLFLGLDTGIRYRLLIQNPIN